MLVLVTAMAACGNYSNEDLEYMAAVPQREDVAVTMPPSSLMRMDEAELSRITHDVIIMSDAVLDLFLGIVDVVRTFPPTQRLPRTRIWGPVLAEREVGWQWRFVVNRDPVTPTHFTYALEFQRVGDPPTAWHGLFSGWFEGSSGARRGVGEFIVQTTELRAAGYPFENGGERIDTITVNYSTREFPISVEVDFVQFSNFEFTTTNRFHFEHSAQENGQGAMRFQLDGPDLIAGPVVDSLLVTTRWLPSGAGRGEATITQGDAAAGLQQVQCWNASFMETYNVKPWKPDENSANTDPSVCPDIPAL